MVALVSRVDGLEERLTASEAIATPVTHMEEEKKAKNSALIRFGEPLEGYGKKGGSHGASPRGGGLYNGASDAPSTSSTEEARTKGVRGGRRTHQPKTPTECWGCGKEGHKRFQCRNLAKEYAKEEEPKTAVEGKKKVGERGEAKPGPTCWHCGQQGHLAAHCTYDGATTEYGVAATEKVASTSTEGKGRASREAKGKSKMERCEDHHLKSPLICWHCGRQGHGMAKCINYGAPTKYGARLAMTEASRVGESTPSASGKKERPQRWKKPSEASRPKKATASKKGGEKKKKEESVSRSRYVGMPTIGHKQLLAP